MGYGFVEYKKRSDALKAIKELQVLCIKSYGVTVSEINTLCQHSRTPNTDTKGGQLSVCIMKVSVL